MTRRPFPNDRLISSPWVVFLGGWGLARATVSWLPTTAADLVVTLMWIATVLTFFLVVIQEFVGDDR